MDLILIGYGKMNRLVETVAAERGDRVVRVVDVGSPWPSGWTPNLVAIDFSIPDAVLPNLERTLAAGIPSVIGTTGWLSHLATARKMVEASSVGVVYGANFSVGVQALYRLVETAAAALPREYDAFIVESHHRHKLDAPSGTGRRLSEILAERGRAAPVASVRAGAMPGEHTVGFDAEADTITITHTARSRRGFAEGALRAAHWLPGRRGLHDFGAVAAEMASDPAREEKPAEAGAGAKEKRT